MKKTIGLLALAAAAIFAGSHVDATLYDYYREQGEKLPSVEARKTDAEACGIYGYRGTKEQNVLLEECLRGQYLVELPAGSGDEILGVTPRRPTEFKTFLSESKTAAHSDTTVIVSSMQTKDGFYIDPTLFGDSIVLSINPGRSNSENVKCTSFTTSTRTFSGCTFGYRFDDPLNTASVNIKGHSPGEPVIISNTDTFLALQYFSLDGTNIITGTNTISNIQTFSVFPVMDRVVTPTGSEQFATKRYADNLANVGSPTATFSGIGLLRIGTRNQIASSTVIDDDNPLAITTRFTTTTCDRSGQTTSTLLVTTHTGLLHGGCVDASYGYSWTGSSTFTASTTFTNGVHFAGGTTYTNVTTTAVTSTYIFGTVVSTTNLFIGSVQANQLVNGSNVASTTHTHEHLKSFASSTKGVVAVNNTTADTNIFSWSIPANTIGTAGLLWFRIPITTFDIEASGSAGEQITVNLKYGASTVASCVIDNNDASALTGYRGWIEGWLAGDGATNAQFGNIQMHVMKAPNTIPVDTNADNDGFCTDDGTSAIDATTAQNLVISSDWSAASGNSNVTYSGGILLQHSQ